MLTIEKKKCQKQNVLIPMLRKQLPIILLVVVLLLQIVVAFSFASKKEGYHIDETYSYILSNSYDTDRISRADEYWGQWKSGEDFNDFVTVQKGEGFSYDRVYYNNSLDAHPPLYYYLLHTVCSVFPNTFNKWLGLGLNLLLFAATQVVLFLLAKKLTGSVWWAVAAVALYGAVRATIDMVLFIRMYTLLTFLTVLFVYTLVLLLTHQRKRDYAFCGFVLFLGVYTQYYFAIIAAFLCAEACLWLLIKKRWKACGVFAAVSLVAVLLVFLTYPAAIAQITGSSTNNVGKEIAAHITDFSKLPGNVISICFSIAKSIAFGWSRVILLFALVVVMVAIAILLVYRHKRNKGEETTETTGTVTPKAYQYVWGWLAAAILLAIVVITHVSGVFRYLRYFYSLFSLIVLTVVLFARFLAEKIKLHSRMVPVGIALLGLVGSFGMLQYGNSLFLFQTEAENERQLVAFCEDRPLVLLCDKPVTYLPTGNFSFISSCDRVSLVALSETDDVDQLFNQTDCSNGVVFMVLTDQEWSRGFDGEQIMNEITIGSTVLGDYTEIGNTSFSTLYLVEAEKRGKP